MHRPDIVVALDPFVDLIFDLGDLSIEFDQKEQLVPGYALELGGSCSIFAVGAAKLGLGVSAVGRVGTDPFGRFYRDALAENGVSLSHVVVDGSLTTGVGAALCKGDDRAILTYPGSIDALRPGDFPPDLLDSCRHLHIGSFYMLSSMSHQWVDLIKRVKRSGGTVSLDPNWDPGEQWQGAIDKLLPLVDLFMPNETEARCISGRDSLEAAIGELRSVTGVVVVKRGSLGASVDGPEVSVTMPALSVDAVDSVGAGDSFDAGFLYGYLSGKPLSECLRLGIVAGSLSMRRRGGVSGQASKEELHSVLSR